MSLGEMKSSCDPAALAPPSYELREMRHDGWLQKDPRIPLFGYTMEIINMLVLPMVKDR